MGLLAAPLPRLEPGRRTRAGEGGGGDGEGGGGGAAAAAAAAAQASQIQVLEIDGAQGRRAGWLACGVLGLAQQGGAIGAGPARAAACRTRARARPPRRTAAFSSVHDLIHAAIQANRGAASLKEVGAAGAGGSGEGERGVGAGGARARAGRGRAAELPAASQGKGLRGAGAATLGRPPPPRPPHCAIAAIAGSSLPQPRHSPAAALCPQVYEVCQRNGRIAYKRAGGSRLITSNDHWKSQIRHALYTSDRFER